MSQITADVLDKLRTFDTPTICNLVELFEVRPRHTGFMDARIKACFPEMPAIVGFAATATYRSSAPPREVDSYGGLVEQVERFAELSGPPIIVFQDLDDPPVAANFGEGMCTAYQAFGAVGLITNGTGRDLDQVRAIGFPTFTSGTICAHAYSHILHVHFPVHVGGLAIYPDNLLHGDLNGVTTIPNEIATELAEIGDEFVAAERIIMESLHSETPSLKAYQEAVGEASERIAALGRRVTRAR